MAEADMMEIVRTSLNEMLRWVGFGTLVGLAAKAIMPGRDPGGAVATILFFYRMLAGSFFVEGNEHDDAVAHRSRRRSRRRRIRMDAYDDAA